LDSADNLFVCDISGCFGVYNSNSSLACLQQSLQNFSLGDSGREHRLDFHGLPMVIVLGHNADVDERTLALLREGGQLLADRSVKQMFSVSA